MNFFENIKIRWLSNWGGDLSVEYCSLLSKLLRMECHLGGFLLCSAFLVENEMTWILKQTDPRTWRIIPIYTYNVGLSFRGKAGIWNFCFPADKTLHVNSLFFLLWWLSFAAVSHPLFHFYEMIQCDLLMKKVHVNGTSTTVAVVT